MEAFIRDLPPGFQLDQYRIDARLGSGSCGITYKAWDEKLERWVAIKEYLPIDFSERGMDSISVHPRGESSDDYHYYLGRFLEEARILARLKHPNIVRVLGYFEANGTAYMVMDFEEGESFADFLKCNPRPQEATLRQIFVPILKGLQKVHQLGFLHRDIKPENIYLRADGGPVLIDFGAARQAIGSNSRSMTSIYSPGYAPAEQYGTDTKKQGPWTDIYGLGATMYKSMSGNRPVDAPTRQGALTDGDADPLTVMGAVTADYSVALRQLVEQMLALPIRQRPQDVAQILARLDAGTLDEEVSDAQDVIPATRVLGDKQSEQETVVSSQSKPRAKIKGSPAPASNPNPETGPGRTPDPTPARADKGLTPVIVSLGVLVLLGAGLWFLVNGFDKEAETPPIPPVAVDKEPGRGPHWSALLAVSNAATPFKGNVRMDRQYALGDDLQFVINPEQDGYLHIIQVDSADNVTVMLPHAAFKSHALTAGRPFTYPPVGSGVKIRAQEPLGDSLLAFVVTTREETPIEEMLPELFKPTAGSRGLELLDDGQAVSPASPDWSIAKYTIKVVK